jgi:uncharacterized protein YeaO (DUF488 family)
MTRALQLSTFQIGTPPGPDEGLRIAVTRRPQRGVKTTDLAHVGRFDVWFPSVAPSLELLERFHPLAITDPKLFKRFLDAYEKELLAHAEGRQTVALLAEIASRMPVSIGCFCEDESHCHRSRLRQVLLNKGKSAM